MSTESCEAFLKAHGGASIWHKIENYSTCTSLLLFKHLYFDRNDHNDYFHSYCDQLKLTHHEKVNFEKIIKIYQKEQVSPPPSPCCMSETLHIKKN